MADTLKYMHMCTCVCMNACHHRTFRSNEVELCPSLDTFHVPKRLAFHPLHASQRPSRLGDRWEGGCSAGYQGSRLSSSSQPACSLCPRTLPSSGHPPGLILPCLPPGRHGSVFGSSWMWEQQAQISSPDSHPLPLVRQMGGKRGAK